MSFLMMNDLRRRRKPFVLVKDEFLVNDAAPLITPTLAEPGPGTRAAIQPTNALSISGGVLNVAAGSGSTNGTILYHDLFALAGGLGYFVKIAGISAGQAHYCLGIGTITGVTPRFEAALNTNSTVRPYLGGPAVTNVAQIPASAPFILWFIRRPTGGSYMGVATKLVWIESDHLESRSLAGQIVRNANTHAFTVDWMKTVTFDPLYPVLTSDYGLATTKVDGSLTDGLNFTHESDCIVSFTISALPSASSSTEIRLRVVDNNNYIRVRIGPAAANTLTVDKVVAGVVTQLISASGAVNGRKYRLLLEGVSARLWQDLAGTPAFVGSSAFATFTATAGTFVKGDGGMSDLRAWPRSLSGDALTAYNAVLAA